MALLPITRGLWSVNRGLARNIEQYYRSLAYADSLRQGDLDGRGNLSAKGLVSWIDVFLDNCLAQVKFQREMLSVTHIKLRIQALVSTLSIQNAGIRNGAVPPLLHLFIAGPLSRGDFTQMTGLGERTTWSLISALLIEGLIRNESIGATGKQGCPKELVHGDLAE